MLLTSSNDGYVRGWKLSNDAYKLAQHPEIKQMVFGNYTKIVYLAQTVDEALQAKAKWAAETQTTRTSEKQTKATVNKQEKTRQNDDDNDDRCDSKSSLSTLSRSAAAERTDRTRSPVVWLSA